MSSPASSDSVQGGRTAQRSSDLRSVASPESGTLECSTFGPAIDRWCDHLTRVRGRAASTVRRYRQVVTAMVEHLDLGDLGELTYDVADRRLRDLAVAGRSRSTMITAVAALRSFAEYSTLVGTLPDNPLRLLRGPRSYQREPDYLTIAETERLLFGGRPGWVPGDWLQARDQILVAVSYAVGLRVSEPGRLLLADTLWDEDGAAWSVKVVAAKWSDEDVRLVVRDDRVGRLLGHWVGTLRGQHPQARGSAHLFPSTRPGGEVLSTRQIDRIFRSQLRGAGIEPKRRQLSFHVLRHSLATHMSDAGWELKAIKKSLRHRSERTTLRYIHTRDERLDRLWRQRHPLSRRQPRADVRRVARDLAKGVAGALGE